MTDEGFEKRRDKYYIRTYLYDELLNGVSAYLTNAQHGIWFKLRMLAANHIPPGTLTLHPDLDDPYTEIAKLLRSKPATLKATLTKLQRRGKIIIEDNTITIINWDKDQPQLQLRFPGKDYEDSKANTGRRRSKASTPPNQLTPAEINQQAQQYLDAPWEETKRLSPRVQEAIKALAKKMTMPGAELTQRQKLTDEEICSELAWTPQELADKRTSGITTWQGVNIRQ